MMPPHCPNFSCKPRSQDLPRTVICYGFYQTRFGRRRRFLCRCCRHTFCSTRGTAYYRLQHRRSTFDAVAALSVEGVSKSSIARAMRIGWNTVDRWLEKAGGWCHRFNHLKVRNIAAAELQADEIRTMSKSREESQVWIFAAIEVWSRLWPSTKVGNRSYQNTLRLLQDVCARLKGSAVPLITSDGCKFYRQVVKRVFGSACLFGQVIKKRRNDRVIKVERKPRTGAAWRWKEFWQTSEDSKKLNTSYIERLNLTIRQGSAYLHRRSLCHARRVERLADHLELLKCHYNFLRPHQALKFGQETRTPAMQAGLVSKRLTFREVFMTASLFLRLTAIIFRITWERKTQPKEILPISMAA